ncbi:MAG: hypothetical protein COW71_12290 [Ignavibacteriales bacterium CG18_big_fil_WC_8_21_14_2_50_31_20]|nr:MAG: hypothetical protein COW71_12290 [Ignavibacteriales bacterium CG18_big_fil_WC_8_21_14_2_50_31_20]
MKKHKQAIIIFALVSISPLLFSCGLWPNGPELTTKYYKFTFIVEADSCRYESYIPDSDGILTSGDTPFILKLQTVSDSPGNMHVYNYSDSSNVYVNFQKTEGERFVEKDYVVKPNEFISIGMGQ